MRILTIGTVFRIPLLLYDLFLYGGILLVLLSAGMLLFGAGKQGEKKHRKVWLILAAAGVFLLVPIVLSMIYGLGESVA